MSRDASMEDVKSAYRKLAMEFHPDRNPDGEERFKEVTAAYEAIKNPQPQQGPFPDWPGDFQAHFDAVFGHGHRFRPVNTDIMVAVDLSLEQAFVGCTIDIAIDTGESHKVVIPRSIEHGQRIRIAGAGRKHPNVPPGDLYVVVRVHDSRNFQRGGANLQTYVEIDALEAIVGTTTQLRTIDDRLIEVTIPPGTQYGANLRVAGFGMFHQGHDTRGDLYVGVVVKVPMALSEKHVELLARLKEKLPAVTPTE